MNNRDIVELEHRTLQNFGKGRESYLREDSNKQGELNTICIVTAAMCSRIKVDDIEMIEKTGRKLHIYTSNREYEIYEQIDAIAEKLVERGFYRAIKSVIINFDKVMEIDNNFITFQSGRSYIIGRNNMLKTKKAFRRYLMCYPPFMKCEPKAGLAEAENIESLGGNRPNNDTHSIESQDGNRTNNEAYTRE